MASTKREAGEETEAIDDAEAELDPELEAEEQELGEDEEIDDLDDALDEDLDDETASELKAVDEALSQKELNAKSLAIRRALEERAEEKRLHDDLDYLDD